MKDKIFLIVRLVVTTTHPKINDAIRELETETQLHIPSTKHVEVLEAELLKTHCKPSDKI
jgi:hypothetical protein